MPTTGGIPNLLLLIILILVIYGGVNFYLKAFKAFKAVIQIQKDLSEFLKNKQN